MKGSVGRRASSSRNRRPCETIASEITKGEVSPRSKADSKLRLRVRDDLSRGPRPRLLREQPTELSPHILHSDFVVRLLPENLPVGRTDDETMILEAERLNDLFVFRGGGIQVLAPRSAFVFLFQPAHGGLDLGADRSAGKVVVSHLEHARRLGKRENGRDRD